MQATKRRWDKCGGILGYHIIHSYAPGGLHRRRHTRPAWSFARRLLGERYEAVVATHLDREHLHCHIVFNSVSLVDGSKYRSDFKSYFGTLRGTSNAVSRERGLSVIEPEHEGEHYAEWDAENRPTVPVWFAPMWTPRFCTRAAFPTSSPVSAHKAMRSGPGANTLLSGQAAAAAMCV